MKTTVAAPLKVGTPLRRRPFLNRAIFVTAALSIVIIQLHAADALTESLQKGLFEEEANHNLDAAIKAYQGVLARADEQRRVAATALFRLAECYRKQGKTNEATAEYRRLLRDYADQSTLVTLSRQNLAGLGAVAPIIATTDTAATEEEEQEIRRIKALIKNSPDLIHGSAVLQNAARKGHLLVAEYLLANGADVNARYGSGETPLFHATVSGHKRMVELLLSKGAIIQGHDSAGSTPLHIAAQRGFLSIVEVLVKHGANVNIRDNAGRTPLHDAVSQDQFKMAEYLIEQGADVNASFTGKGQQPGDREGTPLHVSVQMIKVPFVKLMLSKGADANARTAHGLTPLHYIAGGNNMPEERREIAAMLIAHKAEVEAREGRERTGWTPLMYAVSSGGTNLVKLFLENGADVNAATANSGSPLLLAVQKANTPMVELLLRYKPDLDARASERGYTPLLAAVSNNKFDLAELLLKSGADPNATNNAGSAAIHIAVEAYERSASASVPAPTSPGGRSIPTRTVRQPGGSPELPEKETKSMLELLLDYKADPNLRNKDGYTPLQLAIGGRPQVDAVRLLLARNADPNRADSRVGDRPLHWAIDNVEITELLLAHKADPNATNGVGSTPLHRIGSRPNTNVFTLLIKHGADVNACDRNRETPLHTVLKSRGYAPHEVYAAVRFLLQHGADLLKSCDGGSSPLEYVQRYSGHEPIQLLQGYLPKKYAFIRLSGPVEPRFWFWESDQKLTLSELFKSVALQEQADPRQITILREDPRTGLKRQESHNLVFIREKITPDVPVQDGDQIWVATRSP